MATQPDPQEKIGQALAEIRQSLNTSPTRYDHMKAEQYQRLYNVDEHLREVVAGRCGPAHIDKAVLTAFGDKGPHLLDKLTGYNYNLTEWLLILDPNNREIFWTHPAFKL